MQFSYKMYIIVCICVVRPLDVVSLLRISLFSLHRPFFVVHFAINLKYILMCIVHLYAQIAYLLRPTYVSYVYIAFSCSHFAFLL